MDDIIIINQYVDQYTSLAKAHYQHDDGDARFNASTKRTYRGPLSTSLCDPSTLPSEEPSLIASFFSSAFGAGGGGGICATQNTGYRR